MFKEGAVKIAALFSYCGGPLFIADLLKPRIGTPTAFAITFPPVLAMVMGALFMDEDLRSRWAFTLVRAGRLGVFIVAATNLYAIWRFVDGVRVPDQKLHYIGIVVGVVWSIYYLRATRRWAPAADDSAVPSDPSRPKPIEPT